MSMFKSNIGWKKNDGAQSINNVYVQSFRIKLTTYVLVVQWLYYMMCTFLLRTNKWEETKQRPI